MRALLLTAESTFDVTDVPEPDVGPSDVLVRVQACGICGSDVHGYDGSSGRRIPPLVMGHEAAGVVEAVGADVTNFAAGDRVTFDSMVSCGACHFCAEGQRNLCDNRRVLGVSCGEYRRHGAFAEFISVPERIVYKLPDSIPFEEAALIEAVSVAVHAANRTSVTLGDSCVVVGTGMIGLLVVQAMRLAGCSQIIAVDLDDNKLSVARELGADVVLNPKTSDVLAEVQSLTHGRGADIAVEVVGATPTLKTAVDVVRKGGQVTLVGNLAPAVDLPLQSIVTREISLNGTCGCNGEYPACIDLLERGDIKVAPLITARTGLADAPAWFDRLHAGEEGQMKVIVTPQDG